MIKTILTSLALLLFIGAFSQSSTNRKLSSFDGVSAQEGIDVLLKVGNSESAQIEASGIPIEDVRTEVSGSLLRIHLEGDNHRNADVKVTVTFVALSNLKASSAASITALSTIDAKSDFEINCSSSGEVKAKVSADDMDVNVSSSGDVELKIDVASLDARLSSAGDISISGSAQEVDVNASSSGDFDGFDLACEEADLRASSGASIKVTVNRELDARASSGADIRYKGSPKNTDVSSSSGGSIKKY